jgi:hypothetical protein
MKGNSLQKATKVTKVTKNTHQKTLRINLEFFFSSPFTPFAPVKNPSVTKADEGNEETPAPYQSRQDFRTSDPIPSSVGFSLDGLNFFFLFFVIFVAFC